MPLRTVFACLAICCAIVAGTGTDAHATAMPEPDGGFKLRKIAVATDIEDERLRSKNGSQSRRLLGAYPHMSADARYDRFYFGGKLGPRKLTGLVGDGPGAFRVDAFGYRVSGYGAWAPIPGLFVGLGGAYQKDSGELSNAFVQLNAELDGYEIRPLILAVVPYEELEFEFFVGANLIDATLVVDGFPDERFKTEDADAGAEILAPLVDGVHIMLGVEGRYTWRQDVVLGGAGRDKYSAKFEAGLDFAMPSDTTFQVRLDMRPFDSVANDRIFSFKLVRKF